jgi:hypothetical protein
MHRLALAVECGVHRSALSEAMSELERLGLAEFTPIASGALIVASVTSVAKNDSCGIVLSEGVPDAEPQPPVLGGSVANGDTQSLSSLSFNIRLPQVQEIKPLSDVFDDTREGRHEAWLIVGALVAVGVWENIALNLAERIMGSQDKPFRFVVSHIRAWQASTRKTGVGLLVRLLESGEPLPEGTCPDCGRAGDARKSSACPTCAEFTRQGYLQYATVDDDEDEA